jgi:hypothetical protein
MKTQSKQIVTQVIFLVEFKTVIHVKIFFLCGEKYNTALYLN